MLLDYLSVSFSFLFYYNVLKSFFIIIDGTIDYLSVSFIFLFHYNVLKSSFIIIDGTRLSGRELYLSISL